MQYVINEITSIPNNPVNKLREQGIKTVGELMEAARTPADRRALASATGIEEIKLFKWVNYADLTCIDGLDPELTTLLEEVGTTTMLDLRGRSPFSLHSKIVSTNQKRNLVDGVPDRLHMADIVIHAKSMEPRVTKTNPAARHSVSRLGSHSRRLPLPPLLSRSGLGPNEKRHPVRRMALFASAQRATRFQQRLPAAD